MGCILGSVGITLVLIPQVRRFLLRFSILSESHTRAPTVTRLTRNPAVWRRLSQSRTWGPEFRRFKRNVCSNQKLTVVAIVTVGVRFYHACAEEVALKPQNCSLGSSQTVGLSISEQTVTELRGEGTVTCLLLTFKWTCSRCRAQHNQRASELWCLIKQLWTFRRCFIFALCVLCGKS